ncbi:DUF3619 family protein [Mitsuaria sp. TWR114]|nr:DUF3619 family protein [Mitsuaria sp. TWR114]
MKKNTPGTPLPLEAEARVTRFGLRVAAGLTEQSETLSGDIQERLRFAREQALAKAMAARAAAPTQAASETRHVGNGTLALGGGEKTPRWRKAAALLPLALLWFGLGSGSLIFVLVHAVLWPLALAASAGFAAVPETLRMAGRNYGLRGPRYVAQILLPAALPAILSGLRVGWAFAWRTLIAAELFFGASSGQGGLGWYIFQNRNELMTDRVFAGLALVILIGWLVERLVFSTIERVTVRRWGMQR